MSYTAKKIRLTFQLGTGNFGTSGFNKVVVDGLRVSCKIIKTGSAAMNECQLRVFGLSPSIYNSLTSIYQVTQNVVMRNTIIVEAGDTLQSLGTVFIGQITLCQIDLNSQPDVVLNIIAQTGLLQALAPIPPTSYPTQCNVATALASLAVQMGMQFQNYGVTTVLGKSYFPGTARQQALAIIRAAGIKWNNLDNNILAIWPEGGSIAGVVPLITPDTDPGMIGYPSYSNIGIGLKVAFNPNIIFGGQVKVESSIPQARGVWNVFALSHTLESELPGGQWMTEIQGSTIPAGVA